jgi:4-phytase / acid phosphatase
MMAIWSIKSGGVLRAAVFAVALVSDAALAADHELLSTVVVSRHGVRSPIAMHPPLASVATDPWPSWPVPPGYLTPRGAELAKLLGAYYREHYAAQGLFDAQGCPPPGAVFAWADVDQRTRLTAQALLDGMFPGCNLEPGYRVGAKVDPLFHPTRAGSCHIDAERARQAVLDRAGGDLATLPARFRAELAAMQSVLKCCQPALCRPSGASASCALGDLPSTISAEDSGSVRLSGPIAIASTAAEVFLLEYAQGFPEHQVAWGRASTPQALRPLLRLHTLQFDLMQRTRYLAIRQGSPLVEAILAALQRVIDADGSGARRLTLLVGHDTNLSNIGGMLGLHWSLPSYLPDQTPPAGALHFELLRDRQSRAYAVRIAYLAQTLDQMRGAVALDRARPPERATVSIEGCETADGGTCPWSRFATLAKEAVDRACIGPSQP